MEFYKKIFKAHDLLDCFKPLLYTGKVLLVFPYHTSPNRLESSETLGWISFAVVIFNLTTYIYAQVQKSEIFKHTNNPFVILSLIRLFLNVIYSLVVSIQNKKNHKHVVHIFKKFQNLEKLYYLSPSDLRPIFFISIMIATIMWILNLFCVILMLLASDLHWINIIYTFQYIHGFALFYLSDLYYIAGFAILSKFVNMAQSDLRNLRRLYQWREIDKIIAIDIVPKKNTLRFDIFEMRLAYKELLDTKEYINDVFSFQILATFAYMFVEIVFFAFLNIVILQRDVTAYLNTNFLFNLTDILFLITKFYLITRVSNNLTMKLKNTGKMIYEILSVPQQSEVKDEVNLELDVFILA